MAMTTKQKILNTLSSGKNVTTNQIRSRFGIERVSARIRELREEGHVIYTNVHKNSKGKKVFTYRLGQPTTEMLGMEDIKEAIPYMYEKILSY